MELRIQSIHFDINERLTAFINKKADRLVRRYPDINRIDVVLKVVKPETAMNKEVVLTIGHAGTPDVVATKVADTFEEATDLCLEALERQLEKKTAKK